MPDVLMISLFSSAMPHMPLCNDVGVNASDRVGLLLVPDTEKTTTNT